VATLIVQSKSTEDRYIRELRRVRLAQQMLQLGVRQSWVQQWTGCSERRIRSICCASPEPISVNNRRGPVPARAFRILSTALLRSEASAILGLSQRLGVLPVGPVKSAGKSLPGLALGERLCWLFGIYQEWVPDATLTMEQFLLLVLDLAEQKALFLSHCDTCGGFLVIDRLETRNRECAACALVGRSPKVNSAVQPKVEWNPDPQQRTLF
jgi:hypothetical protein